MNPKPPKIGEYVKSPCGHKGVIVWVSLDGKFFAVQCVERKKHKRISSDWRKRTSHLNPVYILEVDEP